MLFEDTLQVTALSPQVRRKLTQTFAPRPLNACYVLQRRAASVKTMAGLDGISGTSWRPDREGANGLLLTLFTSPDVSHAVRALLTAEGFRGTGQSSGFVFTEIVQPTDTVVAERIRSADLGVCTAAAAAAARRR